MYEKALANDSLKLFTELLSVPSPTGREELVAAKIMEIASRWGYKAEQDYAGNVTVKVKGNGKSERVTMLAAHMDEIGLVITGIDDDGKLRVGKLGGMLPWKIGERPVDILTDHRDTIVGSISFGTGHNQVGMQSVSWDLVRIITGLTPQELAEKGVRTGSVAVPLRADVGPVLFGKEDDPCIAAWTFDDRMGCANLLRLMKVMKEDNFTPNCDLVFAFSKQEEVKGNGIKLLTVRTQPDVLLCIDGGAPFKGSDVKIGGGVVAMTKDKLADYSFDVILAIKEAAKAAGQKIQFSTTDAAYTDASLALQAGGPMRVAHLGFTKENSHGYEVMHYSMLDIYFSVLYSFVKTFVP
jgi:putative aminopeptidase FrvX